MFRAHGGACERDMASRIWTSAPYWLEGRLGGVTTAGEGEIMSGGDYYGGWLDPRGLIEARSLFAGMLELPRVLSDDRLPREGLGVLLTLSGHQPLWSTHAVAVGMSLSTDQTSAYWLTEATRSSSEVFSYLERFDLPVHGVPFAAAVVAQAIAPERLAEAARILGASHAMCSQSCTFGGTLDRDCYYACILEA